MKQNKLHTRSQKESIPIIKQKLILLYFILTQLFTKLVKTYMGVMYFSFFSRKKKAFFSRLVFFSRTRWIPFVIRLQS